MYTAKMTKKEKEGLLMKLFKLKEMIEFTPSDLSPDIAKLYKGAKEMIASWRAYCRLPAPEQVKQLTAWDEYHKAVKTTLVYAMVQEQSLALKKKDLARVRELAGQVKQLKKEGKLFQLTPPAFPDPWKFNYGWVKAYQNTERKIKELKAELDAPEIEEMKEIWNPD